MYNNKNKNKKLLFKGPNKALIKGNHSNKNLKLVIAVLILPNKIRDKHNKIAEK